MGRAGTAWLLSNPCSHCRWEDWVLLREGWGL